MTNPENAPTHASVPDLPAPPAAQDSTHRHVKGYTTRNGTVVAPYQRRAPTPRPVTDADSPGWLVVKYATNGGLVVQFVEEAMYQDAIVGAIDEAKTYGELRRLLPEGEWDKIVDRLSPPDEGEEAVACWLEDAGFDWNTPFSDSLIDGYSDGDYPRWAQAEMDGVLPEALLKKYATSKSSVHNGPYWHIPHESADALIADLRALGYRVEDGANYLRGW